MATLFRRTITQSSRTMAREIRRGLFGTERKVSVIGAASALGQGHLGVDTGPTILRAAGLEKAITDSGWKYEDCGDIVFDKDYEKRGGRDHIHQLGVKSHDLAELVYTRADAGDFVLTLGGDHSIAIGSVAGMLRYQPGLGIIWVDAHADINQPETSGSGNYHGMPVAFLMKLVAEQYKFDWMDDIPKLKPEQIVYVGLRSVDVMEKKMLQAQGIKMFTMNHIDKFGIGKVMEMALEHLGDRPLHLSYDIDALDPGIAPSTGTPVRGGMTFREAHFIAEDVYATGRLSSMDMVEVNPMLEATRGFDTAEVAVDIIGSALGRSTV